jgi:phosphate-selective porin OprO/OprP
LAAIRSPAQLSIFSYRTRTTPRAASAPGVTPVVSAENRDQGTVHAFGSKLRLNPQAYWYVGGFGLFGEYVSHAQEVRRGRAGAVKELTQSAWQATATWYLTGEQPHFRTPRPRHGLVPAHTAASGGAPSGTPGNQGWGALELVARVSAFKADEDGFGTWADPRTSVSEALTYGGGISWHLSRSVKWANNYEYTEFKDGAALTVNGGDRESEHIVFTRLQFSL